MVNQVLVMPANVLIFGITPKYTILIMNVNKKNIPNENLAKEKEYNLISINFSRWKHYIFRDCFGT